ncbi:reverse transcriptase family protein [Planctomycetes bacterium K23_9]|uniref:RNA-directed DNA polymerase n=1 Tax=Stieleria marina TaxID=1930275 RepID=A0A517NX37_9BACT|nr:Reverse transcriptase (RNA-dependent DNA polymerase) [Planctomycetes bacterium K23_9]
MTARRETRIDIGRARLVRILIARLNHRWLETPAQVLRLTQGLFGSQHSLEKQLATQLSQAHRENRLSTQQPLSRWLLRNELLIRYFRKKQTISICKSIVDSIEKSEHAYRWRVPAVDDEVQLAKFLLLGSSQVLQWLTLPHRRRRTDVNHYRRRAIPKRDGTLRWIESPSPILKRTQRIIAADLLPHVPLHDAAMGFRRGHSIHDSAARHVGKASVLRLDLQDFFGSIHFGRVRSLFAYAGYSSKVASTLAMLCTAPSETAPLDTSPPCITPLSNSARTSTRSALPELPSRLPQGTPTSPAIANAIAFRMDRRLDGLATAAGANYTRYADDLVFSFDSPSVAFAKRFATSVAVIAMEEGFKMNFRKTRLMRRGNRQRVLGMTVNEKLNVSRQAYETLKAILHNCAKRGPRSQNRTEHPNFREHLRGRIAHVASIHTGRGNKLTAVFETIDWDDDAPDYRQPD